MKLGLGIGLTTRPTAEAAFTPADIFDTQGFFLDFTDLSSMRQGSTAGSTAAAVDSAVGYIADKSGNGNHATQATQAKRPILKSSGGLYWLEFDGNKWLDVASYALTSGAGAHSASCAAYIASGAPAYSLIDSDDGSTRVSQIIRLSSLTPQSIPFNTDPGAFVEAGPDISVSTAAVLSSITASAACEVFTDGVGDGSTAITGTMKTGPAGARIGAQRTDAQALVGRLYAGAVQLARAYTSDERTAVEAWIAERSGVTL
jgi:hypothetical protein